MGYVLLSGAYPIFFEKSVVFVCGIWYYKCDRRKARVMPESKYSIGGIKNGISILFFYNERGCRDAKY